MNYKPLNELEANYSEFYEWLKEISRYSKIEHFVLTSDYKQSVGESKIRILFYTKDNRYSVVAIRREDSKGYLGCQVSGRKPRAGIEYTGGRDLSDGAYCYETWQKIKNDIISYELVKVANMINPSNVLEIAKINQESIK